MSDAGISGWDRLRHGGLLLDPPRLRRVAEHVPAPLSPYIERELRRRIADALDQREGDSVTEFVSFVLDEICGFDASRGAWHRGPQVGSEWGRRAATGETTKPRHLWLGRDGDVLPVFIDAAPRLGIGRGRKAASQTVHWLRAGSERLAVLTNGRQWRLVFAGLDFDAWCEWDIDVWLEEGVFSPQVDALRTLVSPALWTPPAPDAPPPLLEAILDSRKGQAELSGVLGERVREAVELLVQAHGEVLKDRCANVDPAEIYRAAARVVMRMVVVLFAESRELLPRDAPLYNSGYGLTGLLGDLEKVSARSGNRLGRSWNAWPRVLALFRLVHQGSHHPALPVPAYGGELFAPGDSESEDGLTRTLAVFETACFEDELLSDRDVLRVLEWITRTRVKIRQGRSSTWIPVPVDFTDLSSEYIGILYEGLLDYELRTAPAGDPVVFLAVGNQPALPLSRLEEMDNRALASLLEKLKVSSSDEPGGDEAEAAEADEDAADADEATAETGEADEDEPDDEPTGLSDGAVEDSDDRHATRTRAEAWARRAVEVGKLVPRLRGRLTPEKRLAYEDAVARKARQLVVRVVLPGEWYLVRWGGTRKGSGTFYTRPGLAVPTVQRTLRPLAYDPPLSADGTPDRDARAASWSPKTPEDILALKVCDPACGSGSFPVAALRFLTEALYASLHQHGRIADDGDRAIVRLLQAPPSPEGSEERLAQELLPCPPDDPLFEPRLKAVLRRHVVERCIYGVDLDPLAVELCRLALWIETMDRTLPFSFLDHKIKCGNSLAGAWFDQFQHYPVMAWKNREGGDKNHTNGVHFEKDARTKLMKAFVKEVLTPDVQTFLGGPTLLSIDLQDEALKAHADDLATLGKLHDMPVQESAERSRIYREELLGSEVHKSLRAAMDLWCACWFWPTDQLEHAPLPTALVGVPAATRKTAELVASRKRFFHWELEFPDVFRKIGAGFDAVFGNPPWDIAKPNSKEYFSNIDPLYASYGKQEALRYQTEYFADEDREREWLDYNGDFRAQSNYMGYAASPFGDPVENESSQDRFAIVRGNNNTVLHARWRDTRAKTTGFADPEHSFRHQGSADLNLYKAFLEQAHLLLRSGGRLGFIVPSGLYSDHGTGALRRLFLDQCRWEWLFGFENRDKVFEIDSRFKFNPIIIEKGGTTAAIRTAFMRRKLEDWESAEAHATPYARAQVERFSPRSKAILEIQSARDLEILEKIYANSVLLGDDGPDGWGIRYATEFHMTNDSKLFPPRPSWEADGYRPDEYSRWLKGDWRPIGELWAELGVRPLADGGRCCAQPPYDTLPIPRADIPPGILLSRDADAWVREDRVEDVALPLYEGRMIGQFDFSQKGWVSGKGRGAVWRGIEWSSKQIEPQYLMASSKFLAGTNEQPDIKLTLMDVTSSTNTRTVIATAIHRVPCGHKTPTLVPSPSSPERVLATAGILCSYVFDYEIRARLGGNSLIWSVLAEAAVSRSLFGYESQLAAGAASLSLVSPLFGAVWLQLHEKGSLHPWKTIWRMTEASRVEAQAQHDALVFGLSGLTSADAMHVLAESDAVDSAGTPRLSKGFWRVDKEKKPELRQTVLTLVAFQDLQEAVRACGGDRDRGTRTFLSQNDGEGWMLPETLRLADYGLGHDDRAKEHQPVASCLGPRFYDWQLAQTAEESWRECHLHARNCLGESGYRQLLGDIEAEKAGRSSETVSQSPAPEAVSGGQASLFE